MERNLSFDTEGLEKIAVHLGWAQLEMFADEVDKVQVMAAGDDSSVEDLRIAVKDGCLTVEQPQYGLSLNIMECRWLQVCVRVPSQWKGDIALSTLSGLLSARKLCAKSLSLETVSGDLHAVRICAADASLIRASICDQSARVFILPVDGQAGGPGGCHWTHVQRSASQGATAAHDHGMTI